MSLLTHDSASGSGASASGEAVDLAKDPRTAGVDVIVAGHNHGKFNSTVNGKLIVEANSYGNCLADVDLELDPSTGTVVSKTGVLMDVNQASITPDPNVTKLINDYLAKFPQLTQVLGTSSSKLVKSGGEDTNIGNLIADGMKDAMKSDFAFMNNGGIRQSVDAGTQVTYATILGIQPFGNQLMELTMTGAQIKTLLEQQWDNPTGSKVLSISGIKFSANTSLPKGSRILWYTFTNGAPIKDDVKYTVTVNDFMAGGGDGYLILADPSIPRVPGPIDIDAFFDYIYSPTDSTRFDNTWNKAKIDGRIAINRNVPKPQPTPNVKIYSKQSTVISDVYKSVDFYIALNNAYDVNALDTTFRFDSKKFKLAGVELLGQQDNIQSTVSDNGTVRLLAGFTQPINSADFTDVIKVKLEPINAVAKYLDANIELLSASTASKGVNLAIENTIVGDKSVIKLRTFKDLVDINEDGEATISDLSKALESYQVTSKDPNWSTAERADVNFDGVVDIADFTLIMYHIIH